MQLIFLWETFWVMAFINMGAQVSTITWNFCEQHMYDMYPMKQMFHSIPGYTEATVRIPSNQELL